MALLTSKFDDEILALLARVDSACSQQYAAVQAAVDAASLAGDKEFKLDIESIVWMEVAKAYGVLYNRAIDAGWVKGVLLENEKRLN